MHYNPSVTHRQPGKGMGRSYTYLLSRGSLHKAESDLFIQPSWCYLEWIDFSLISSQSIIHEENDTVIPILISQIGNYINSGLPGNIDIFSFL